MRGREIKGGHGLRLVPACAPRHLFPEQETLYAPHRPVKYQVVSFCFIACVTRRKVRYRFYIRESPLTWNPLTESNRRPSPYHPDSLGSLPGGRVAGQPPTGWLLPWPAPHPERCSCGTRAIAQRAAAVKGVGMFPFWAGQRARVPAGHGQADGRMTVI